MGRYFYGKKDHDEPEDPHPEEDEDAFLTGLNTKIEASLGLRVAYRRAAEAYQVQFNAIGTTWEFKSSCIEEGYSEVDSTSLSLFINQG